MNTFSFQKHGFFILAGLIASVALLNYLNHQAIKRDNKKLTELVSKIKPAVKTEKIKETKKEETKSEKSDD